MNFGMNMLVFVKLTQKTSFSAFDKLLSNFNASVDLFGFLTMVSFVMNSKNWNSGRLYNAM